MTTVRKDVWANGTVNTSKAYGVGHASFTTSLDDTEDWIIYVLYYGMRNPFANAGTRAPSART